MSRSLAQLRLVPISRQPNKVFGPTFALANMMSPKIDELRCFINDKRPDLVSLTETWIYDSDAYDHHLHIPGNNLIPKTVLSVSMEALGFTLKVRTSSKP